MSEDSRSAPCGFRKSVAQRSVEKRDPTEGGVVKRLDKLRQSTTAIGIRSDEHEHGVVAGRPARRRALKMSLYSESRDKADARGIYWDDLHTAPVRGPTALRS